MIKTDNIVNGFIAEVDIIDRATGEVVGRNVVKSEHHKTIEALNADMAKFNLPTFLRLVRWVS
jgi:hypothetical protein